jgi:DNA-binding response OmpR family regulator
VRVLVVEDERRLADNIARSLREASGYAVDIATDGDDGLFMAETNPYDLILLDLMLPHLDGLSLLKQFRAGGHEAPVLVLTAREEKESVATLLNTDPQFELRS